MKPSVCIYAKPGLPHQQELASSFLLGLRKHGIDAGVYPPGQAPRTDVVVCWGWAVRKSLGERKDQRFLIAEAGYFDNPEPRLRWVSLGWDGLNGRADFRNENSPVDRWQKIGVPMRRWRQTGDSIVLIGQTPGDQALAAINLEVWLKSTIEAIKAACPGQPILYKPHPRLGGEHGLKGISETIGGTIQEAAENAFGFVTFNSTSAVESVLAGIPTVAMDQGSMAWAVTSHEIGEWVRPARKQWCYDLAYSQWSHTEIQSGSAWAHLWD